MAITPPPTPPNTGNPAQLEERADSFFGWFPSFVTDFNNDLALLRGKTWAARGGSANAITLTAGVTSLVVGTQVRFQATSTNTGAATINLDGLGAIACRTITGVALPAGYIRTDAETLATYDGTFWVVDRQIERGSNANGFYVRFADGTQICTTVRSVGGIVTSFGALFRSNPEHVWTFPAAFTGTDGLFVGASPRGSDLSWGRGRAVSSAEGGITLFSAVSSGLTYFCEAFATGRWYA